MRLVQVITDYIRRSILTTQGDMVVRGVGQPERLAAGLAATFLAGQGVGAIPAYEGHKLSDHGMKIGTFFRSTAGNLIITGVGFRPSLSIFLAADGVASNKNFSIGFDYLTEAMVLRGYDGLGYISVSTEYSIFIRHAAGNYMWGNITAFGNDGFTITFTFTGAPSAVVVWIAIE